MYRPYWWYGFASPSASGALIRGSSSRTRAANREPLQPIERHDPTLLIDHRDPLALVGETNTQVFFTEAFVYYLKSPQVMRRGGT